MSTTILKTRNEGYGFHGTIAHHFDAEAAWADAFAAIRAELCGWDCGDEAIRDFLDSRHGRHFADDVCNGLHDGLPISGAVEKAIERWMGWTISRRTSLETGIPQGLPHLVGYVVDCQINAESFNQ